MTKNIKPVILHHVKPVDFLGKKIYVTKKIGNNKMRWCQNCSKYILFVTNHKYLLMVIIKFEIFSFFGHIGLVAYFVQFQDNLQHISIGGFVTRSQGDFPTPLKMFSKILQDNSGSDI